MCDSGDCNQCQDARWEMEQQYQDEMRAAEEAEFERLMEKCRDEGHRYFDQNRCWCGMRTFNGLERAIDRVENKKKS